MSIYLTVLLLATNGLFAKGLPLGSVDITIVRGLIAGLFLAIISPFLGIKIFDIGKKDLAILLGLGVVLIVHWVSLFEAIRVSSVAIGMTVLYTYPVFTVFLEAFFLKHPLSLRDVCLAGLVIVGVYVLSPIHSNTDGVSLGVIWGLVSSITFSLRNVLQRRLCSHIPPIKSIAYQSFTGACFLMIFASPQILQLENSSMMYLLLLGIVFTALPHTLLAISLKYLSAKTASFIGCLQPVIAAALALIVIDEKPELNVILGGLIILSAAAYETTKSIGKPKLSKGNI